MILKTSYSATMQTSIQLDFDLKSGVFTVTRTSPHDVWQERYKVDGYTDKMRQAVKRFEQFERLTAKQLETLLRLGEY